MASWTFEPGHTAAEFRARHMMVTYVRGHFKNVRGTLRFDPENPSESSVEVTIDAKEIWTGDADRNSHLRNADFLDVGNHPHITFKGSEVEVKGAHEYAVAGDLTIRGVTRRVALNVTFLGQWDTPWWEDGVDKGPKTRAGFVATTSINRHDFNVSWNADLDKGGLVVGDLVDITLDAERSDPTTGPMLQARHQDGDRRVRAQVSRQPAGRVLSAGPRRRRGRRRRRLRAPAVREINHFGYFDVDNLGEVRRALRIPALSIGWRQWLEKRLRKAKRQDPSR